MTYLYSVYGLIIDSCIEFPELIAVDGVPDVHVRRGQVPTVLTGAQKSTARFQAKPGYILLTGEHIGRILVSNGAEILVEGLPGVQDAEMRSFVLGSALGAILHQRKLLPIHASSIRAGEQCVMFCGGSGAGKSTLASLFVQRGYVLQADDLCAIGLNQAGKPLVYAGYPQFRLCGDALARLGCEPSAYRPIRWSPNKFAVPTQHFNQEPLPLGTIFILRSQDRAHGKIMPVTGITKYEILKNQIYRGRLVENDRRSVFNVLAAVTKQVRLYRVDRPKDPDRLEELADAVETIFKGESSEHA